MPVMCPPRRTRACGGGSPASVGSTPRDRERRRSAGARDLTMDPAYVATHVEEDRRHWWFRGRLAVLLAILRRVLPPGHARLLELGCGTGNVLAALAEFGEAGGMEAPPGLAATARAAGLDVRTGRLPDDLVVPPGRADAVLPLDVIEHLDAGVAA